MILQLCDPSFDQDWQFRRNNGTLKSGKTQRIHLTLFLTHLRLTACCLVMLLTNLFGVL